MSDIIERAKRISECLLHPSRAKHAARVASALTDGTDVEIAAAHLHDILEDTNLKESALRKAVGDEVTDIVKEVTNPASVYDSSIRDFSHLASASKEAKRIKLCDRIDNITKRVNSGWTDDEYVIETEKLLEHLKDADSRLSAKLQELIDKLRANGTK